MRRDFFSIFCPGFLCDHRHSIELADCRLHFEINGLLRVYP